jgi:hypothetical protein
MSDATTSTAPRIKIDWIFGLIAAFMIFVVIATYSSRMARDATDYDAGRRAERLAILKKQQDGDTQILTTADWVDQTKGTVRIPIDEAIPQAITALQSKPVQMGAAIPGAAAPAANTIPAQKDNNAPAQPKPEGHATAKPTVPPADAPNK